MRCLIVLVLGCVCCPLWAGEVEERHKIHEQIAIGEYKLARAAIDEYREWHPDSEHIPALRLAYALTYQGFDQWFLPGAPATPRPRALTSTPRSRGSRWTGQM